MALQINNFTGFETQGAEEAFSVSGAPTYPTTDPNSGAAHLSLSNSDLYILPFISDDLTDQGNDYIVTFSLKVGDKTPTAATNFLEVVQDADGFRTFALQVTTGGNVEVLDSKDNVIRTIIDPLSTTAYQLWQVHYQFSATGTIEVFIEGSSQGQDTNQNLSEGTAADTIVFRGPAGISSDWLFDDVLVQSGAADANDKLSGWAVKTFQNTAEDATDQGDTLANGTWALVSETPGNSGTSNDAFYQDDTGPNLTGSTIMDEGDRAGPSGDSDITGATIKAAKYISNLKKTGGAGRVHTILHGNSGDGVTATADLGLSNSYIIYDVLSESASIVPTISESFQMGFSKSATAGADIFCGDQWAMLGYVPAAVTVPVINLVMAPYTPT